MEECDPDEDDDCEEEEETAVTIDEENDTIDVFDKTIEPDFFYPCLREFL